MYSEWVTQCFEELCQTYGLKVATLNKQQYAVIGQTYLLLLCVDADVVVVSYIRRNENGVLMEWHIDQYEARMTTEEDRAGLQPGGSVDWVRMKHFLYISRTLKRAFQNLLEGKTDWMVAYKASKYAEPPRALTGYLHEFAERYI